MTRAFALILIAATLRSAQAVFSGDWADPLRGQPSEEVVLARGLAAGRGFISPFREDNEFPDHPSAHSPPAYPYFLAGLIRVTRVFSSDDRLPYRIALLTGIVAGSLATWALAVVGGAAQGRRGFWTVGLMAAVWPTLVRYSASLWDTPMTLLAISVAPLIATSRPAQARLGSSSALGFACGVSTLFNPLVAPLLAAALVFRTFGSYDRRKVPAHLAAAFGVWLLCLAPWLVRNAVVFHRFIPIRHNYGLELWIGNLPGTDGSTHSATLRHPMEDRDERRLIRAMGDDPYMILKTREAIELIHAAPGRFVRRALRRMALYWFGDVRQPSVLLGVRFPMTSGVNSLKIVVNGLLLIFALLGTRAWGSYSGGVLCWLGIVGIPLPYYITHVSSCYRSFVDPLLCLLAGIFLASLRRRGASD